MQRFGQTTSGNGTRNGEAETNGRANGGGNSGLIGKEKTNGEVEKADHSTDEHAGGEGNFLKNKHVKE